MLCRGFVKSLSVRQCMHRHLDMIRLDTQTLHAVPVVHKVTESETIHAQTYANG